MANLNFKNETIYPFAHYLLYKKTISFWLRSLGFCVLLPIHTTVGTLGEYCNFDTSANVPNLRVTELENEWHCGDRPILQVMSGMSMRIFATKFISVISYWQIPLCAGPYF